MHIGYRNGENEWKIAVERGPTYTLFADSLETVKGGHDLVGDARRAVVEHIADGLRALRADGGPVVVED